MARTINRSMLTSLGLGAAMLAGCSGDSGTEAHAATRLAFVVQPIAAVQDTAMAVTVSVAVLDENGNVFTSAANPVTLGLGANPGGATLSGTTAASAISGVASFPGLKLSAVGTGYSLVASSAGLTSATSNAFDVTLSLADVDGDGVSPQDGDCDDSDPNRRPGLADDPDATFLDSNCDGIDGTAAGAIFVLGTGADAPGCGTRLAPCATVGYGIAKASVVDFDVYIGPGTYTGSIQLAEGVSLYGGFSATWERGTGETTEIAGNGPVAAVPEQDITIYAEALGVPTTIADVNVRGVDAVGLRTGSLAGRNSYGIVARQVAAGKLTIERATVFAGNGAPGAAGANGASAPGTAAPSGDPGGAGAEFVTTCDNTSRGLGGAGASNPGATGGVSATGGRGGDGGTMDTDCNILSPNYDARPGQGGENATLFQALVFGYGGNGGSGTDLCGPTTPGAPGRVANGAAGSPGSSTGSLVDDGYWNGSPGGDGALGSNGSGGGGGGGSGGCDTGTDAYGAGGGGGGAGGARAPEAGQGGTAGGGSFGIYLIDASPTLSSVTIVRGDGGIGGAGGTGGTGQSGGQGGPPGAHPGSAAAGFGGDGAHGGHGGGGAGGSGGWSVGILSTGTSAPTVNAVTYQGGSAGSGGEGGASGPDAPLGERDGNDGPTGTAGTLGTIVVR